MRVIPILFLCAALPAHGQTPVSTDTPLIVPLAQVFALAARPFEPHDRFAEALQDIMPLRIAVSRAVDGPEFDPFAWTVSGSFGTESPDRGSGAIFWCARYGLATREAFAERGFAEREMFRLMRDVQPQPDDATVWPEGALARLSCNFTWDDRRAVSIVPRAEAFRALALAFEEVTVTDNAAWGESFYGPDGFSLTGAGGTQDSVARVESAQIVLTIGHQSIEFRSFLMGGGA